MACPTCASGNQSEFPVKMIINSPGLKNVDAPGLRLFPKFLFCLDCGYARVTVPETELALLAQATPTSSRDLNVIGATT